MFIFCNIACGNSLHKDITLNYILQTCVDGNGCIPISVKFLQSKNDLLRLATIWCMINLVTDSNGPEGCARASKLFDAGVTVVIGQMVNDPNTDVKVGLLTCLTFNKSLIYIFLIIIILTFCSYFICCSTGLDHCKTNLHFMGTHVHDDILSLTWATIFWFGSGICFFKEFRSTQLQVWLQIGIFIVPTSLQRNRYFFSCYQCCQRY